ncbi:MAG: hypothetical protein ABSD75_02255 [Terriglobales bacterium]|jgi:hypothetical protein
MFEAEVEMERRSSILPLLLMMCLLAVIVGTVMYVFMQMRERTPLSAQQATPIVAATLQAAGPATTHFHTGLLKPGGDVKPEDPNYRLLEKAGIVKLGKAGQGNLQVTITPDGEKLLSALPGVTKVKQDDGTYLYKAPVADRLFLVVNHVDMIAANTANVQYSWKWVPNQLGDLFDASGPQVKSFNTWERQTLINKYAVDFYHGDPTRSTMALMRTGKDWKIATR